MLCERPVQQADRRTHTRGTRHQETLQEFREAFYDVSQGYCWVCQVYLDEYTQAAVSTEVMCQHFLCEAHKEAVVNGPVQVAAGDIDAAGEDDVEEERADEQREISNSDRDYQAAGRENSGKAKRQVPRQLKPDATDDVLRIDPMDTVQFYYELNPMFRSGTRPEDLLSVPSECFSLYNQPKMPKRPEDIRAVSGPRSGEQLLEVANQCPYIQFLSLAGSHQPLGGIDVVKVAQRCRHIEVLNLDGADVSFQHVIMIISLLPLLKVIGLHATKAGEEIQKIPEYLWPVAVHATNPQLALYFDDVRRF